MKRGNDFFNKKKFGFFQKNLGPKKHHVPPHLGNKKFFGKKNDTTFTRNFGNKSLIHSRTNFINPKGFNMNSKYKNNKTKENFNDNNKKNNFRSLGANWAVYWSLLSLLLYKPEY